MMAARVLIADLVWLRAKLSTCTRSYLRADIRSSAMLSLPTRPDWPRLVKRHVKEPADIRIGRHFVATVLDICIAAARKFAGIQGGKPCVPICGLYFDGFCRVRFSCLTGYWRNRAWHVRSKYFGTMLAD